MVRTNQGGSVLGFVIIGGVLALLLIGGAYFVRQQAVLPPDTGTAPQPTETKPEGDGQQEEQKPDEAKPDEQNGQQPSQEQQTQSQNLPGTGAEELPRTGPAESFATIAIFAALAAVTAAYVQSRRLAASL